MLHILAGQESKSTNVEMPNFALSQFQKDKLTKLKTESTKSQHCWNTLFLGSNTVAENLAEKYEIEKRHLLVEDGECRFVCPFNFENFESTKYISITFLVLQ